MPLAGARKLPDKHQCVVESKQYSLIAGATIRLRMRVLYYIITNKGSFIYGYIEVIDIKMCHFGHVYYY